MQMEFLKIELFFQFFGMIVICFILEIAGASYILVHGTQGSQLNIWLEERFYELLAAYTYDDRSKRTVDIIQEWVSIIINFLKLFDFAWILNKKSLFISSSYYKLNKFKNI